MLWTLMDLIRSNSSLIDIRKWKNVMDLCQMSTHSYENSRLRRLGRSSCHWQRGSWGWCWWCRSRLPGWWIKSSGLPEKQSQKAQVLLPMCWCRPGKYRGQFHGSTWGLQKERPLMRAVDTTVATKPQIQELRASYAERRLLMLTT